MRNAPVAALPLGRVAGALEPAWWGLEAVEGAFSLVEVAAVAEALYFVRDVEGVVHGGGGLAFDAGGDVGDAEGLRPGVVALFVSG